MSEAYLGEIRVFSLNYAPKGWAQCNGQLLSIMQNQALFSLLGTTYGGDGKTTFALPNLQGNVAIGFSSNHPLGQKAGEAAHTLTVNEMPAHTHLVSASSQTAGVAGPGGAVWAASSDPLPYGPASTLVPMNSQAISSTGSSQPHANLQPYLALNFCIATEGIYPSRN